MYEKEYFLGICRKLLCNRSWTKEIAQLDFNNYLHQIHFAGTEFFLLIAIVKKGARAAAEENQLFRCSWFSLQPVALMIEFPLNPELRATQSLVYLNYFNMPSSWLVYCAQVPGKLEMIYQIFFCWTFLLSLQSIKVIQLYLVNGKSVWFYIVFYLWWEFAAEIAMSA